MELSEIAPSERTIEIVNPGTGEEVGVSVTIMSMDDERMKTARRLIQNRALQLQNKGKTFKADEVEDNKLNLLYSAITSWVWRGDATFNGEKPELNRKNVYAVLTKLYWMREQIEAELADEKAFF